jgi:hypothetical protein
LCVVSFHFLQLILCRNVGNSISDGLTPLLAAAARGKFALNNITRQLHTNAQKIYGITIPDDSSVEIDADWQLTPTSEVI